MGREKCHDFGFFDKAFFVSFIVEIVFRDGFAGEELVGDWTKATSDDSEPSSSSSSRIWYWLLTIMSAIAEDLFVLLLWKNWGIL
ncbi:hypothetical protein CSA_017682, partial [Cucumis sativus]